MIVYDAFGEDGDFNYFNGSVGGGITILTTGSSFRAAWARCGVAISGANAYAQRLWPCGPQATAWHTFRVWMDGTTGETGFGYNPTLLSFVDANGLPRLIMVGTGSGNGSNAGQSYAIYKQTAAGARTLLGYTQAGFSVDPGSPDKLDWNYNYANAGGFLNIFINKAPVFTYTGDITSDDGLTGLAGVNLGRAISGGSASAGNLGTWSEFLLANSSTLDASVFTSAATAVGTADGWNGAVADVSKIAVNDATFDTTSTSGSIQRYKMTQVPTGNYSIAAKVTSLRNSLGGGSLTHLQLAELIDGNAYTTAPVLFNNAFGPTTFIQATNPATGLPWTIADLNSATRESGYEATT